MMELVDMAGLEPVAKYQRKGSSPFILTQGIAKSGKAQDFGFYIRGSNPLALRGCNLIGKIPHCGCGVRGSNPLILNTLV